MPQPHPRPPRAHLLLAALTLLPTPAQAAVAIDASFDSASLASWSGNTSAISLTGRTNYFGEWRWMYFKATGLQGATPTFTINQNFAQDGTPGPHELVGHSFVYSYDNTNWSFFSNNTYTPLSTDRFQFSNSTPFTSDTVYIAYALPYQNSRYTQHTQTVLASPYAKPTKSANAQGIIGQTAQAKDDLNRTIASQNLYAYKITDPATDGLIAKRKVGLSSGLHAGETLGSYTYEGLINWLISDDPHAVALRKTTEFYCYPVLNPAGRFAGLSRSTPANINRDPNGLWNETLWSQSANLTTYQDVRVTGQAMLADIHADSPTDLDIFIDFHSTVPDYDNPTNLPNDFGYLTPQDAASPFWQAALALNGGNLLTYASGQGSYTTTGYARRILGADIDITVETQFSWERNTDYYHQLGENFGEAFYQAYVITSPLPEPSIATLALLAAPLLIRRYRRA